MWSTAKTTNLAISGDPSLANEVSVTVSKVGLYKAIHVYEQFWANSKNPITYQGCNHNSNYAVNSILYGLRVEVPDKLGYTPGFPNQP